MIRRGSAIEKKISDNKMQLVLINSIKWRWNQIFHKLQSNELIESGAEQ